MGRKAHIVTPVTENGYAVLIGDDMRFGNTDLLKFGDHDIVLVNVSDWADSDAIQSRRLVFFLMYKFIVDSNVNHNYLANKCPRPSRLCKRVCQNLEGLQ